MKSGQIRVTIIILILVFGLVGYYSYLTGKAKTDAKEAEMTAVEKILSRDLVSNYPPTPKEVMKYYNDIMICYYSDDVTNDEIDELGIRARELFDPDLQAINETGTYLVRLHSDIREYKEAGRKITNASTAASTSPAVANSSKPPAALENFMRRNGPPSKAISFSTAIAAGAVAAALRELSQ